MAELIVNDSNTVELSASGNAVTADVVIDPVSGNALVATADGLSVQISTVLSGADASMLDFTAMTAAGAAAIASALPAGAVDPSSLDLASFTAAEAQQITDALGADAISTDAIDWTALSTADATALMALVDTDAQVVASADGSVLVTATTQPDGRLDYDLAIPLTIPNVTLGTNQALPFGEQSIIAPLSGAIVCAGATFSVVAGSEVNVASVSINADGTHAVEPDGSACSAGVWSYDYTVTCPDGQMTTSTVSGVLSTAPVELARFSTDQAAGTDIEILLILGLGGNYNVDWGDGTISSGVASGALATHTYPAAFSGDVVVTASACEFVTSFFSVQGAWNFNIADLPSTLETFENAGSNTTFGDIADLPAGLTFYRNAGNNTTTGDIAGLPATLESFNNDGDNTTFGDIANLPSGMTLFFNSGDNTTTGDIGNLPSGLVSFQNTGDNTTFGDISNLPAGMTFYRNAGDNTTTGDIAGLPTTLESFNNDGDNTTFGDIANLPVGMTLYRNIGDNVTTGDIGNLSANMVSFSNAGDNTTFGNVDALPAGMTFYRNEGDNTTGGDIGGLPAGIVYYENTGLNTAQLLSAWTPSTTFQLFEDSGTGLTTASVDGILAALATVTTWTNQRRVDLAGPSQPPTAAGLASCATILANGASSCLTN